MAERKERDYRIDNIKGILILLVVFGHLLELILKENETAHRVYMLIYIFHMPLFIYTTGYFAKCNWKKIVWNLVYPYVIFQIIYLVFARNILHSKDLMQLKTPYWLLWYLFAVAVWTATEPLWNRKNQKRIWIDGIILFLFIMVALICGNWSFVGREFTLSRILVFLPFFVAGAFTRKWTTNRKLNPEENLEENLKGKTEGLGIIKIVVLLFAIGVLILTASYHQQINRNWLYEATSYETSHYGMLFRGMHLLAGFVMTACAMMWVPNVRWKGINWFGTKTLQIFLLHGFLIKLFSKYGIGNMVTKWSQEFIDQILQLPTDSEMAKIIAVMILFITAILIVLFLSVNILTFVLKPFTSPDAFWKQSEGK